MYNRKNDNAVIVFKVYEDLVNFGHSQIVCKKGVEEQFVISRPRLLSSYSQEFCGKLDIQSRSVRFFINSKEADPDWEVKSSCIINVYNVDRLLIEGSSNMLKDCLHSLRSNDKYADVVIDIESRRKLRCHKFILTSRSEKFRELLQATETEKSLKLSIERSPRIQSEDFIELVEKMIDWIYTAEVLLSDDYRKVMDLALLADEFRLEDLKRRCEEFLVNITTEKSLIDILLFAYQYRSIFSPNFLEMSIHCFIEDFDRMTAADPLIEKKLFEHEGLVTKMLIYINQKKNKFKRVSFLSKESSVYFD
jgi:hypothetical protein